MTKRILIQDVHMNQHSSSEVDPLLRLNAIQKPSRELGPLLNDVHFRHVAPVKQGAVAEKTTRPKRPRWRRKQITASHL